MNFILQRKCYLISKTHMGTFLTIIQNVHKISIQFFNGIRIAWMERHGDHRLNFCQIHKDHTIIICHCARIQLCIILTSSMDLVELLDLLICLPDRGQTSSLRSHNIDTDTEVCT